MSHDLRAPVVNLKTLIDFYDQSLIHKSNQEIFEKVEISVKQLSTTLNELIEVVALNKKSIL